MRSVKDIGARMMGWIIPTVEAQAAVVQYVESRCFDCGGFDNFKPQQRTCTGTGSGKVCGAWRTTGFCGEC